MLVLLRSGPIGTGPWFLGAAGSVLGTNTILGAGQRSVALSATAGIGSSSIKIPARAAALSIAAAQISAVGARVLVRQVALSAASTIAVTSFAGTPSTVTYDSASITYDSIGVTYEGVVESGARERSADLSGTASIAAAGRKIIVRQVVVSATAIFHARVTPEAGFAFAVFGIVDRPDYFEARISPDSLDAEERPSMFALAGRPSSFSETDQVRE